MAIISKWYFILYNIIFSKYYPLSSYPPSEQIRKKKKDSYTMFVENVFAHPSSHSSDTKKRKNKKQVVAKSNDYVNYLDVVPCALFIVINYLAWVSYRTNLITQFHTGVKYILIITLVVYILIKSTMPRVFNRMVYMHGQMVYLSMLTGINLSTYVSGSEWTALYGYRSRTTTYLYGAVFFVVYIAEKYEVGWLGVVMFICGVIVSITMLPSIFIEEDIVNVSVKVLMTCATYIYISWEYYISKSNMMQGSVLWMYIVESRADTTKVSVILGVIGIVAIFVIDKTYKKIEMIVTK